MFCFEKCVWLIVYLCACFWKSDRKDRTYKIFNCWSRKLVSGLVLSKHLISPVFSLIQVRDWLSITFRSYLGRWHKECEHIGNNAGTNPGLSIHSDQVPRTLTATLGMEEPFLDILPCGEKEQTFWSLCVFPPTTSIFNFICLWPHVASCF